MVMPFMAVSHPVTMAMMVVPATQEPRAANVHGKTKTGNRDRLGKVDWHRREDAADGLATDQKRDHREDDGTRETREIAELARPERKARIIGVFSGVPIGERGEQQCACMRAHVHTVGYEGNRAEQETADNLSDHHGPAEPDHGPRLALALFVPCAQEHMGMQW
jgi:hypothetical protein